MLVAEPAAQRRDVIQTKLVPHRARLAELRGDRAFDAAIQLDAGEVGAGVGVLILLNGMTVLLSYQTQFNVPCTH